MRLRFLNALNTSSWKDFWSRGDSIHLENSPSFAFIMGIPVLSAACREQENASTGRAWVVRSSSSLRRVMFADPTTRDSLKRPWSHTKSQIGLGPKFELTCLVTGVVTASSVWITTPRFGSLIFLRTHGQQQWSGSWGPNPLGTVFQNRGCQATAHNLFQMNLRSSVVIRVSLTWQAPRHWHSA